MSYLHYIIQVFGSHFLGLTCSIIQFIRVFLLLYLSLLVLIVFGDFDFARQIIWSGDVFIGLVDQRRQLRRPKMIQHGHTVANTTAQDKSRQSHKAKQDMVRTAATTGSMWWLPRTWMGPTGCPWRLPPPRLAFFLCSVSIPDVLCVMFLWFCDLKAFFFQPWGGLFSFLTFTIIIFQIRFQSQIRLERKREAKFARIPCQVCDRAEARFGLSISFPSLLFSHFQIHVL